MVIRFLRVAFLTGSSLGAAAAAERTYDFSSPGLPSGLEVELVFPGFTPAVENGALRFEKAAGHGAGPDRIQVRSTFTLTGDFTVTVKAIRGAGSASAGLNVNSDSASQSMYLVAGGLLWSARADSEPNAVSGGAGPSGAVTWFRLRRSGNVLSSQYDTGGGFNTAYSVTSDSVKAPMRLMLFIMQEVPDSSLSNIDWDDLHIIADGITDPEPPVSFAPTIRSAVQITWPSQLLKRYQVQWTADPENPVWTNLGPVTPGDGTDLSVTDPMGDSPRRFYRITTVE